MRRAITTLSLALVCFAALSQAAVADPSEADRRTLRLSMNSEILGERRAVIVRVPDSYFETPAADYPLFFVSDADWNFELVAAHLDYLAEWGRIPEFIVVGALNTERNRDFLPREDPGFPFSGQGDRYLAHLDAELLAMIENEFRLNDHAVIFGHSFGGVLVLNQMLSDPERFDAHIALGASVWVAERVLFERTEAAFEAGRALDTWLYLSVGEGDGGATVPDGDLYRDLLDATAPDGLDWSYRSFPEENHFTNVPISLHDALGELFPFWDQAGALEAAALQNGPAGVDAWFDDRQDVLGWRFVPQSMELSLVGVQLAEGGHAQAAGAVFDQLEAIYPDRAEVFAMRAVSLVRSGGDQGLALGAIRHAIAVGERTGHPRARLESFRRVEARLAQD